MQTTRLTRAPLEGRRNFREAVTIRSAPIRDRLAASDRKAAFLRLWADAKRKPDDVYEISRGEPRCALPDEKQRTMMHRDIRAGLISRDRLFEYRLWQILDDLEQFPDDLSAEDALYVRFVTEWSQALDAQTEARGVPSPERIGTAIRETKEALVFGQLRCARLAQGITT